MITFSYDQYRKNRRRKLKMTPVQKHHHEKELKRVIRYLKYSIIMNNIFYSKKEAENKTIKLFRVGGCIIEDPTKIIFTNASNV